MQGTADEIIREYVRAVASKGGKARAKALTKAQRVAQSRKAGRARWAKHKKALAA